MPRKGLIYFGHPCDHYDVAALLNIQNDHIGVNEINSIEAMTYLKAEELARASHAVVVNAEDPLCLASLAHAIAHRHILVSKTASILAIKQHCEHNNGEAVFVPEYEGERHVTIAQGTTQTAVMPINEIPATMRGLLPFNESNALFAIALAWAQGLSIETIRTAMMVFGNTPVQNPGCDG